MAFNSEIEKLERRWADNPLGLTFAPLAEAYRKSGDPARALELLRSGLEIHPDYIPANIVLGRCLLDVGDDPGAENAFTHVLSLDRENVIAIKALADLTERHDRLDESAQWLETLLSIDRSSEEGREQLARVNARRPVDRFAPAAEPAAPALLNGVGSAEAVETRDAGATTVGETLGGDGVESPLATPEAEPMVVPLVSPLPDMPDLPPGTAEMLAMFDQPTPHVPAAAPVLDESMGVEFADVTLETVEPSAGSGELEREDDIVITPVMGNSYAETTAADELAAISAMTAPVQEETFSVSDAPEYRPFEEDAPLPAPAAQVEEPSPPLVEFVAEPVAEVVAQPVAASQPAVEAFSEPPAEPEPEPEPEPVAAPDAFTAPPPSPEPEPVGAAAGGGDDASVSTPHVMVVTESMAELYLAQGHRLDALSVYRKLAARDPGDVRLAARVAELAAAERQAAPARRSFAAAESGGTSVAEYFSALVASQASLSASPDSPPLEESPAAPGDLSFDEFFRADTSSGGAEPQAPSTPASAPTADAAPEDLDQFQAWLQSLKR